MWVGTSLFAASRLTFADLADHHKNGLAFLFFIFTLPFQTRPSVWLQNLAWSVFLFFSQFSYASADFFPFPPRRGSVEGKKQATQPPPPPPIPFYASHVHVMMQRLSSNYILLENQNDLHPGKIILLSSFISGITGNGCIDESLKISWRP